MGDTRRVGDGKDIPPVRQLRQSAPPDGPSTGPGAAPDSAPAQPPTLDTGSTPPGINAVTAADRRFRPHLPSPRRAAVATARAVNAWSRGPSGRLTLPALLLLALVTVTGAAGALLVPATANPAPANTAKAANDPDLAQPAPTGSGLLPAPTTGVPAGSPTTPTAGTGGRPADTLAAWAQQTGDRVGIPPVAIQAYGYAELVLTRTKPECRLTWTTLAAIGLVESNHGRANGATLSPDGAALPPIIGLPLDGTDGRQRIADTDAGRFDGDRIVDRAVGPMQFIPTTWQQSGVDADSDGVKNPNDIDDAALAAGNYLCGNGRDLSTAADWWRAVLSYNEVRPYAQAVFDAANRYGTSSRT